MDARTVPTNTLNMKNLHDELGLSLFNHNVASMREWLPTYLTALKQQDKIADQEIAWLKNFLKNIEECHEFKEILSELRAQLISLNIILLDFNKLRILAIANNDKELASLDEMAKKCGKFIPASDLDLSKVIEEIVDKGPNSFPFTNAHLAMDRLFKQGVKPTSAALKFALELPALPIATSLLNAGASVVDLKFHISEKMISQLEYSQSATVTAGLFYKTGILFLGMFFHMKVLPFLEAMESDEFSGNLYAINRDNNFKNVVFVNKAKHYAANLRERLYKICMLDFSENSSKELKVDAQKLQELEKSYHDLIATLSDPSLFELISSDDLKRQYEFLLTNHNEDGLLTKERFSSQQFARNFQENMHRFEMQEMPKLLQSSAVVDEKSREQKTVVNAPSIKKPTAQVITKVVAIPGKDEKQDSALISHKMFEYSGASGDSSFVALNDGRAAFTNPYSQKVQIWSFNNNEHKIDYELDFKEQVGSLVVHPKTGHLYVGLKDVILIIDPAKKSCIDAINTKQMMGNDVPAGFINNRMVITPEGYLFAGHIRSKLLIDLAKNKLIQRFTPESFINGDYVLPEPYVVTIDKRQRPFSDQRDPDLNYITIIWNKNTKKAVDAFESNKSKTYHFEDSPFWFSHYYFLMMPNGDVLYKDTKERWFSDLSNRETMRIYKLSENLLSAPVYGWYSHETDSSFPVGYLSKLRLAFSDNQYVLYEDKGLKLFDLKQGKVQHTLSDQSFHDCIQLSDGRVVVFSHGIKPVIHLLQYKCVENSLRYQKQGILDNANHALRLFQQKPAESKANSSSILASRKTM
jgi:hypothetical protein